MVDSDSEYDFTADWDDMRDRMTLDPLSGSRITFTPSDHICRNWNCISADTKKLAAQQFKICAFWFPILLQPEEPSSAKCWALEIGLINHNDSEDLSLRHLHKIEIIEAVLRALEKGTLKKDQAKHVFLISNMFNVNSPEALEDALYWLERTGEPAIRQRVMDFGHAHICFRALSYVFFAFVRYILDMGNNLDDAMKILMFQTAPCYVEKSEQMKKKGNENFQRQQYEDAVRFYSKAIKYCPENHIIYGNRALCYIRSRKYLKAVGDGKRATLIKPLWAKGHYRYCEALFFLGEVKMAIEANNSARRLCKDDQEGLKDLEQQHLKFITEMVNQKVESPKKTQSKRADSANRGGTMPSQPPSVKAVNKIDPTTNSKVSLNKTDKKTVESPKKTQSKRADSANRGGTMPSQPPSVKAVNKIDPTTNSKVSQNKTDKKTGKNERTTQAESSSKDTKPSKSGFLSKTGKVQAESPAESNNSPKKKPKNVNQCGVENQKVDDSKAVIGKELRNMVQDAYTALDDLRSHNAEQAFSKALALLETTSSEELGLSTLDVLLLLYGRASALTEIGQPEELGEAQRLLERIKSFEERTFQCLVFYAVGRVFVKENRFAVAQEQFSDSLQMVKNQITPGKLTWPLTKEVVKETQPVYLKEVLENAIEMCRFPPTPDAVCRLEKSPGHMKAEIYFTDPDFKGFIQICCCQKCIIEYHVTCWKTLKASSFSEKKEKEFLQDHCLTPDCVGQICSIKIFDSTGLVKCKFDAAIPKPHCVRKPKVNQKCTSLKKLKSKEEHRLKRKQHKQAFQEKQAINDEILQQKEASASQTQQKAWLLYRDRVLLQLSQNMELFRAETALPVSRLIGSLKPWLTLDSSKGNQLAVKLLCWEQERLETVGQVMEVLLERKNRVWARVVIQLLSSCLAINQKLYNWAYQLDNAGLNAAKRFIERYSGHLEQMDLSILFSFDPLQEMIIEKLGTRPEFFSSIGLTVTEYLKQAPPHDMRLFIWALEEYRDEYVSCHSMLDEYFDIMDGHCSVLKKSDENQINYPMRSRGRKKKQREPRGAVVFQKRSCVTPPEEWDQDVFEDDSLSFLHPDEPFSVPSRLREQVADFENQYNTRHRSPYRTILNNNPDPTKESLYDYFAQILEEHGPLVAEDPLLVGELVNFPAVAQVKIQEAGGFEPFLLDSLRFIKIGRLIGLAKHDLFLHRTGRGASLDQLDDLDVIADTNTSPPDLYSPALTTYSGFSSAQTQVCPILPSPYVLSSSTPPPQLVHSAGVTFIDNNPSYPLSNSDCQKPDLCFYTNNEEELDLYSGEVDDGVSENDPSSSEASSATAEESFIRKQAAAEETTRSVAVNTELLERFEKNLGDINNKQKSNRKLEKQIKEMENGCDVNVALKQELSVLKEEIQKITDNIQVTNKELALFQQKLEEEVKKDQKEKKANQEDLRALKVEIEELVSEQGSLSQKIREKKANYDTKLSDFLELSNQSAAEKMSLEDEIQRHKVSLASAARRSQTAQLSAVKSSLDQRSYSVYRELANAKALLSKLDEAAHRNPNQELEKARSSCRENVQVIEKIISDAETQFRQQIEQVKSGRRVTELPSVEQPEPPAAPPSGAGVAAPSSDPPPVQQAAHAPRKPATWGLEPSSSTVFEKAIEQLVNIFPSYTRSDLTRFIQELRSARGRTLSSMKLQDVVENVTQLILDHQEKLKSAKLKAALRPAPSTTPPYVIPVWQKPEPQKAPQTNALNVDDPCIICHDDMNPEDICVLECRHSFHDKCIRSWLKEQSTCPTCRDRALLPEDFPELPGRRRPAP